MGSTDKGTEIPAEEKVGIFSAIENVIKEAVEDLERRRKEVEEAAVRAKRDVEQVHRLLAVLAEKVKDVRPELRSPDQMMLGEVEVRQGDRAGYSRLTLGGLDFSLRGTPEIIPAGNYSVVVTMVRRRES